jgi:hypothetical protein
MRALGVEPNHRPLSHERASHGRLYVQGTPLPLLHYYSRLRSSNNLLLWKLMLRGMHIATSLAAILLLVRPLDCFANPAPTRAAADCCKKGNCVPSPSSDDCCKAIAPGGKQLVSSKATEHSVPVFVVIALNAAGSPPATIECPLNAAASPPGSPPATRGLNLPQLI